MDILAKKLGFADRMFKNIKVENGAVSAEDILREINRGGWSTGYCGQSPERLKAHMRNQAKFDVVTLRAPKDDPEVGGDYYGLPWPCWGTPEFRHPGTPVLYNTNLPVKEGGGTFRARFGVERVVRQVRTAGYLILIMSAVFPMLELLATLWPPHFESATWRFGASGLVSNYAMGATIELFLLLVLALFANDRRMLLRYLQFPVPGLFRRRRASWTRIPAPFIPL